MEINMQMKLISLKEWQNTKAMAERKKRRLEGWEEVKEVKEEVKIDKIVKLNEASSDDLCQIKGIGPKIATKIVSGQPYQNLSEIDVSSILKERLEAWVNLS